MQACMDPSHLSIYFHIHPSKHSLHLPNHPSVCPSICQYIRLSVRPYILFPSICPSIHPSIHPSVHPSIHLNIYDSSVYLAIHLFICILNSITHTLVFLSWLIICSGNSGDFELCPNFWLYWAVTNNALAARSSLHNNI